MANYRVSTNTTNKSNKTTRDKTNKTNKKNKENGSAKAFYTKNDLLKISVYLQTALAAETHRPEGAAERGEVTRTYVPSRNTNADPFPGRRGNV
jgi:hypothetical protein